MNKSIVWTIAGSDCTGGAGIQADTKTIHNLGAEACSVITAVTAQNSNGVKEINATSADVIASQIQALSETKPANVIKIGLLANKHQVELIAQFLIDVKNKSLQQPFIIYDPVAIASNGDNLTEEDIIPVIKEKLLPLVDLITPNGKELQKLTGVYVFSWECIEAAAQQLLLQGVGAAIIKGGHIDIAKDKCIDFCTDGQNDYWLCSETIKTTHSHGTGCTFASAIASLVAQNYLLRDAFTIAKAYINQGLKATQKYEGDLGSIWQGQWPENLNDYPSILVNNSSLAKSIDWNQENSTQEFADCFASVETMKLGLYPVVNSVEWLERLLKAGIKTIQYREKSLTGNALDLAVKQAVALSKQYNARLFINDYWELAIKHHAYGVHLGQEDIQSACLTAIKQAGLRLGISTHGYYEMIKVKQYQPSYLAIGAIFPTKTKDMTGQIQGLKTLRKLVALNPDIPTVAIGGINLQRAQSVVETNVGSIAVVTAITEAENPELVISEFEKILTKQ